MRFLILPFAALSLAFSASALAEDANRYEFDKSHTSITFFINHLGFSDMVGKFKDYDGSFVFDEKDPEKSSVEVTVKPASVETVSKELDTHLQKADFFNTAKFPTVTFKSTSITRTGKNNADITGDLTMLGVTKPVVLKTRFNKADYHAISKDYVAGFSADTTIKRSEFGLSNGIPMVGDEVRMHIEVEGVNKARSLKMKKD